MTTDAKFDSRTFMLGEQVLDSEEPFGDTTDANGRSISQVDPLDEHSVTIGMFLMPTLLPPSDLSHVGESMGLIGSEISKMYKAGIHGDLIASNVIIRHPFATKGPPPKTGVRPVHALIFSSVNEALGTN
ncbi:hypothetical protein BDM02DRAFT_3269987 [Thelephora ganbajun]|uniref:Uncharacterized protein n=1 Tax=Thelephora ganbajun TaxID=370292 RepID=A0ACB6ZDV3_THEGA|nr:hypothetical protein BDM02DRAFT_3269987 [Thelephora ganbajun]